MAYDAGTAFLQVVPSFAGVVEKIGEQASKWGETAGKAFNQTFEEATKGLKLGPSDSDSSRQGASSGGAFADGFRAKVDAALKALPDVNIQLNDAAATAKLDDIRARLETLRNVDIGVDISDRDAIAAVEILKGELDALGAKSPSIRVKVDAAEASAELGAISAEADATGSGLGSLGSDAGGAAGGVGGLVAALAVLATALIPIGALAAGALSALPALFAGAASGLGALKIGFSGISGAISAYTNQQNKAAAASGGAGQSSTSAAQAALSAAQQEQSAAKAVATATEALATAQTQAIDSVHRAQEQLTQSEQALASAELNEENAQRALTQARIDAANAITNLNDQTKDGALAVRQAQLDVASAQAALTAAHNTPGTSAGTLAQAQLSADQAQQHLQDLIDQQAQLTQAQQAAAAAGVDGSNQVISATQALGQAQQTVSNDQQAQADATVALSEAQATAVQKVNDAETNLADAIRSQAQTLQQIALSQQAAAASAGGASGATNAFAKAMAGLSPAGRNFVNFVTSTLLPMYDAFKAKVQQALLPGIQTALLEMLPVFQTIEPFIIQAATGIGTFAQNLAGLLSSGPGLSNLTTIFSAGAGFMKDLAKAALDLVPAFLTIGAQASPIVKAIGDGIDHLVAAFAKWVANGGFEKFVKWLKDNGPSIISDLSSFIKGFGQLLVALAPVGKVMLDVVGFLGKLLDYFAKTPAALALVSLALGGLGIALAAALDTNPIGLIITAIGLLILGIVTLVTHWTQVWGEIKRIFDQAVKFLRSGFGTLVVMITGPFAPLLLLALHWQQVWGAIKEVVNTVWTWLDTNIWQPLVQFFTVTAPGALNAVGNAFSTAWNAISGAVSTAWTWMVTNVFDPIRDYFTVKVPAAIGQLVSFFEGIPGAIENALSSLFGKITGAFGDVAGWVNTNIIQPIVGFFSGLPKTIGDFASKVGGAIEDAFKAAFNFVANLWNKTVGSLSFTIPGWVPGLGGDTFGVPQIPTFHDGGIVPGPAGVDVPAILQAGELVIPRNDVGSLTAAAGGTSEPSRILHQEITVTAFDPRTAAIETQQRSDYAAKTRGF